MGYLPVAVVLFLFVLNASGSVGAPGMELQSGRRFKLERIRAYPKCGVEPYDDDAQGCCGTTVYNYTDGKGCCSGQLYGYRTHFCCKDGPVEKEQCGTRKINPCILGCCEGVAGSRITPGVYQLRSHQCCNGIIAPKNYVCE